MTTANEIQRYAPSFGQPRQQVSQATTVEQSRAVAEVQAAVVVAQQVPRDIHRAIYEMRESCGRLAMAEQAFYAVPNRGTGASVHLLRELARAWGNVQHGSHELRRDDTEGVSEVQAFAWDMQANTRTSRTFITPHERMAGGSRKRLTDLGDIQNNNNNIAARAVRECISNVLPRWFVEEAKDVCNQTLEHGEGEPLLERIDKMVNWFGSMGITVAQIEARLDKARGQWDASDVAQMKIAGKSITAGEATKDELFPAAASSTANEIAAVPVQPAAPQDPAPEPPGWRELGQQEAQTAAPAPADEKPAEKPKRAKSRTARNADRNDARAAVEAEAVAAAVAADLAEGNDITAPDPVDDKPPTGDRFYREPPVVDADAEAAKIAADIEREAAARIPAPATTLVDFPEQPGDMPEPQPGPITGRQMGKLFSLRAKANYPSDTIEGNEDWARFLSDCVGRNVTAARDLTDAEAQIVIDVLESAEQ